METDPTAAASESAPATMTVAEPEAPPESPPHTFDRIKEMVEKGVQLVGEGILPGTVAFNQAEGLDWHGFKAWREAHGGEDKTVISPELDALEAKAVVDPDVETAEAKAAREAKERQEETPEARIARVAWEEEIDGEGNKIHAPTHFATEGTVQATDPQPAPTSGTSSTDGATPPAQPPAPAPSVGEPVAVDPTTGKPV